MGSHGDVIGLLLTFDSITGMAKVSFYKNSQHYGVAYD